MKEWNAKSQWKSMLLELKIQEGEGDDEYIDWIDEEKLEQAEMESKEKLKVQQFDNASGP